MRSPFFVLCWLFVLLVALYDSYFAWKYRAVFHLWEMNPLARWMVGTWGLNALLSLKMALLVFALGVACHCHRLRHRLEVPYTLVISGVHLTLGAQYVAGYLQPVW